jgi:hypothetical protein
VGDMMPGRTATRNFSLRWPESAWRQSPTGLRKNGRWNQRPSKPRLSAARAIWVR